MQNTVQLRASVIVQKESYEIFEGKNGRSSCKKKTATFSTCPDLIRQLFETILSTKFKASKGYSFVSVSEKPGEIEL